MKYLLLMLKYIFLAFFCLSYLCTKAQSSFYKSYDFGTVEYIYQIIEYNDRIFINTATWCGLECSFLSEIDLSGNIIWRTEIPDIDIAQGTMVIVNDTITVTGNNDLTNESFHMAHFTLEGQKIGDTKIIEHPTKKFTRMFQLTTQYFNNKYIISGAGKLADNVHYSLIYVVNKQGIIDTLITLDQTSGRSEIWDSFIDAQGRLTVSLWLEEDYPGPNFRKLYKFNESFDTIWSYQTENNYSNLTVPRSCELLDGRTVFAYINPEGDPYLYSIRAVDQDGVLSWQYDYQWTGSKTREIYRLKTLQNGDILGSGQYSELEQDPRISNSPWLFRMSPNGELLWEHVYYDFDSTLNPNGSSRLGTILDFVELDNGDIFAVGTIRFQNRDMLIMRVDSNGCLFDESCYETNISTGTIEINLLQNILLIYPNPTIAIINIEVDTKTPLLNFEIQDVTGIVRLNGTINDGLGQANVSNLEGGMYFISLKEKNQLRQTGRFIKM